jgi:hypothetical protein
VEGHVCEQARAKTVAAEIAPQEALKLRYPLPTRPTNEDAEQQVVDFIGKLLSLQFELCFFERPQDAFRALRASKLAAGYVFGFHDSCLRALARMNPLEPMTGLVLIQTSYRSLFGEEFGSALFNASMETQGDSDFQTGRQSGGEEYMQFIQQKTPPLGLQRILGLGFDAAAVRRTLGIKSK